jgi:hypothetical protein
MFLRRLFAWTLLSAGLLSGAAGWAQLVDEAVMNSTVLISSEVEPPGSLPGQAPALSRGTGFLIFKNIGLIKGQVYLITNRHLLPHEGPPGKPKDMKVRVVVRDEDGSSRVEDVSVPVVGADGKYLNSVRIHPDPATDVAAINIATTAFGSRFQLLIDAITTGKRLDTSMLLTTDKLQSARIGLGSQVYVLGFPAALFDPRNVSPVLRMGVISTDPKVGYSFPDDLRRTTGLPSHINGFLIDSNVYPGSSGSLVIAGPDYRPRSNPKRPEKDDWQPYIIGIVAGSIPIFDAPLRSFERIGLGIVYSADTVKEVIEQFEKGPR